MNATPTKPIEFYGVKDVYSENGVDLTLLRERLKLTVTERWERNSQALQLVQAFQEAGRAQRARDRAATRAAQS